MHYTRCDGIDDDDDIRCETRRNTGRAEYVTRKTYVGRRTRSRFFPPTPLWPVLRQVPRRVLQSANALRRRVSSARNVRVPFDAAECPGRLRSRAPQKNGVGRSRTPIKTPRDANSKNRRSVEPARNENTTCSENTELVLGRVH